jgi:DNA-binding phage protein
MLALRNVAEAQGGVNTLVKKAEVNRQNLYRILSSKGNPRLSTLGNVIRGLGFRLSIA